MRVLSNNLSTDLGLILGKLLDKIILRNDENY